MEEFNHGGWKENTYIKKRGGKKPISKVSVWKTNEIKKFYKIVNYKETKVLIQGRGLYNIQKNKISNR